MSTEKNDAGIWTGILTVASVILRPLSTLRLLPLNVHPVGGLSLFAGGRWSSGFAYFVPLVVMVATDLLLWVLKGADYSPLNYSQPFVYGSFLLYVLLGRTLTRTKNPLRIGAASLLGSLQFFVITNFGAWVTIPSYTRDWTGLMQCYAAGLPFHNPGDPLGYLGMTIIGDLTFTAVFFLAHAAAVRASEPADLESRRIEA